MKNKIVELKVNDMVDTKHNDIVTSFLEKENKIPKLEKKIVTLKKKKIKYYVKKKKLS